MNERDCLLKTPSEHFKWNQLSELYQWFNQTYAHLSLAELKSRLAHNIETIYYLIDTMSDEVLFPNINESGRIMPLKMPNGQYLNLFM